MTVEIICISCERSVKLQLDKSSSCPTCPLCRKEYPYKLSPGMKKGGPVDECVICKQDRFYLQKDFNPRLGFIIFIIGAIFSYSTYGITLVLATIIDIICYKVFKTVTVCYFCGAIYRNFEEDPAHFGFDHKLSAALHDNDKIDDEKKEPSTT